MIKITNRQLADLVGISEQFIGQILLGKKRPSRKTALLFAEATKTDPTLWLYGTPAEIKEALKASETVRALCGAENEIEAA